MSSSIGCRYATCPRCGGVAAEEPPSCNCQWLGECNECRDDRNSRIKRRCVSRSTGTAKALPHLPPELVGVLVAEWHWCDDLAIVVMLRAINRAFADALRHRIYTHAPDVQVFNSELQLMRTFHLTQRRKAAGSKLYHKAYHMIWRRYYEMNPGNGAMGANGTYAAHCEGLERKRRWYQELCLWVQARIELMPAGWGPWVGRMHYNVLRYVVEWLMVATLEVTFKRMYEGERIGGQRDPRRDETLIALIAAARTCLNVANGNRQAAMITFKQAPEAGVASLMQLDRAMDKAVRQRTGLNAA